MARKQTAIIIGAGAGGLALANILAKAGLQATVFEANDSPGGRMGKLEKDGFTFDTGPSWYLMKDVFEDYFKLFGHSTTDYYKLKRLEPGYKVFFESTDPVTITGNFDQDQQTFEALEAGAGESLRRYIDKGERNYQAALQYFLYNPFQRLKSIFSRDVLRSAPAFARLFGQSLHGYVKKQFRMRALQQILEYPSVFLGASPYNTPALYQLMSYLDFKEGVFYPEKKGMHAVTEALCALGKELGVAYHYNSPVERIIVEDGDAKGVVIAGKTVKADIVISNADLHFTEQELLEPQHRSYSKRYWQRRTAGPSALLMYLGIAGSLPELEHHNLFFVSDWRQNFDDIYKHRRWPDQASMYVSKTTATDKTTAPKGHENLFVLVPLPAGESTEHDIDQKVDHYLAELEQRSGIKDLRRRIVVKEIRDPQYFGDYFNSWQNTALGMSHTLRQSAILRPSVKSKKVSNLYYVGAGAQPGIGVPMCIISAQLVYKHLVGDWSAAVPTAIEQVRL